MRRHWVVRDGVRLSYQVAGDPSDRALVLLAGYGRSGSSWIPWLDRVGPLPFRVVLVDHRGTGESARSLRPYTLATLADDVAAVLRDSVGDAPAVVVGESMGGMVAQHLALRHPASVGGLVLSASSARGDAVSPEFLRSLPLTVAAAVSKNVSVWAMCDRLLVHDARNARELLAPLRQIQRAEPYSRLNSLLQAVAMSSHRVAARLGAVRGPVEVLVGADDRVLAPRNSHVLARCFPHARLTVLADTGHAIPFERPAELLHAVRRLG
ncbi:putative aminoacrylate hydrolase RutD [Asanoa ishikariensis]|uniref:Pimeloyl-ACP methyl ester carboxylesterase n=1 Tax=Asanoa ishikariensis TaxID=137265 RepID=A0A1H3UBN0_9ACTN|nr:alpha/beta hydrolase [Asanoa ishikariensis]GIF63894.1 putative aminoacrylate hydrolase RutD [Asanoa ishikariensis]SDZ59842.1 Pimeloyl-ACP methyl ester carboxylesterase [Asanoa ishikariensis]